MMGCVSLTRRPWLIFLLFASLIIASRWPLAPGQLFTFDDVNLSYSIGHFDVRISQPHPPGYPLFVVEMRVLHWLHIRRAESILLVLALTGSVAVLLLMVVCGNRMLGGDSGYYAAWLTVFHPVFWHAGVASALRIQLAVVSLAAGAACWQAWLSRDESPRAGRWVLWSAIVIGVGAGIRPETGPLLFPLWAACALRAPLSWKDRAISLAAMAAAVLVWLLPAMFASGGPVQYVKACLDYISDQASVSSALFGATENKWITTFWRLVVWSFCGLLPVTMPAVLAYRRDSAWGLGWERTAFLSLWFFPAFLFAIDVHVEDPGQTLALVPVVSLFGGYLIDRAVRNVDAAISRWQTVTLVLASLTAAWIIDRHNAEYVVVSLPLLGLVTGLILKLAQTKNLGSLPHAHIVIFLLFPIFWLDITIFYHEGWYYKGASTVGWRAAGERVLADLNSGLALTSLDQIKSTLAVDDHTLRQMSRLAAERPNHTTVVWEHGLAAWRKAAYYAPGVPIVVLEHKKIRSGSPPVIAVWKGAKMEQRIQGSAPLRLTLPAGTERIVWLLNPHTEFYNHVQAGFAPEAASPVYYTDLPGGTGSRVLGEYELAW